MAEKDVSIDELARLARNNVAEFLKTPDHTTVQIGAARIATGVLATHAKLIQTRGARDALHFAMARELATDRDQLAEYIRLTLPNSPIAKALPPGYGPRPTCRVHPINPAQ